MIPLHLDCREQTSVSPLPSGDVVKRQATKQRRAGCGDATGYKATKGPDQPSSSKARLASWFSLRLRQRARNTAWSRDVSDTSTNVLNDEKVRVATRPEQEPLFQKGGNPGPEGQQYREAEELQKFRSWRG